jgi:thiosulfate dehydrogenase [quinone] large subunit
VENKQNFLLDYHLVYAAVLVYLIAVHAGRVCGLDAYAGKLPIIGTKRGLREALT